MKLACMGFWEFTGHFNTGRAKRPAFVVTQLPLLLVINRHFSSRRYDLSSGAAPGLRQAQSTASPTPSLCYLWLNVWPLIRTEDPQEVCALLTLVFSHLALSGWVLSPILAF